jgi:hypothetical protein
MALSTIHLEWPASAVFAVIANPRTYPRWLLGAKAIDGVDPSWPEPGSSFDHEVALGPLQSEDTSSVRDVSQGRRLELVVRARPWMEADVRFEVRPEGNGCVLELTETPRGWRRVAGPVVEPLIRLRNDRSLRRLAEYLGNHGR